MNTISQNNNNANKMNYTCIITTLLVLGVILLCFDFGMAYLWAGSFGTAFAIRIAVNLVVSLVIWLIVGVGLYYIKKWTDKGYGVFVV